MIASEQSDVNSWHPMSVKSPDGHVLLCIAGEDETVTEAWSRAGKFYFDRLSTVEFYPARTHWRLMPKAEAAEARPGRNEAGPNEPIYDSRNQDWE